MNGILLPEVRQIFHDRLLGLYRRSFAGVAASETHLVQMASDSLDENRSWEQLRALAAAIGTPLAGKRLLEIGSGVGLTVAIARKGMGADAFGIEPGEAEYDGTLAVSWDILRDGGIDPEVIRRGFGEAIPFPDDHFDAVYSSNVLEHVDQPPKVIAEIVRVLKPGGHAYLVVPNYGSWWEGHYGLIWLPHLPARLGKLYVRLFGRDPRFIDTLQLVTRGKLERWLAPHSGRVDIVDWGVGTWQKRVENLGFAEYSALGKLKDLMRILHRLRVIPLVVWLGKRLHWETPLILIFRKGRQ